MDIVAILDSVDAHLWKVSGAIFSIFGMSRKLEEIKVPSGNGSSRVLVLSPHPDDESMLGGCLLKHAHGHDLIKVVVMTDGSACSASRRHDDISLIRRKEIENVSITLCNAELEFWPCKDQQLTSFEDGIRRLYETIIDFNPQIIYTPIFIDKHPDHIAANTILSKALLMIGPTDCEVRAYEGIFPSSWVAGNSYVDTSDVSSHKLKLFSYYASQRIRFEKVLSYNRKQSFMFQMDIGEPIEVYLRCNAYLYCQCINRMEPRPISRLATISGRQPMQISPYLWNILLASTKARQFRKYMRQG